MIDDGSYEVENNSNRCRNVSNKDELVTVKPWKEDKRDAIGTIALVELVKNVHELFMLFHAI